MLDMPPQTSAAAFTPSVALYELPGRRGAGSVVDDPPPFPVRVRRVATRTHTELATIAEFAPSNALDELLESRAKKQQAQARIRAEIKARLCELWTDAAVAEEPFSYASLTDLMSFLGTVTPRERPSLFLLDNGNLRALWRNQAGEQVGLQFLGREIVQYVMFARRANAEGLLRHYGQELLSEIRNKVSANGCDHLIG